MPINTLQYAVILQTALDQKAVQASTTGWMEANAGQIKYSGGKEIKIPSMTVDGLADYDRDNGYAQGGVKLEWKTYEMTQDRGRKFQLDSMDVDETNFIVTATEVMNQFQSNHVIPEIDAYRYSKISKIVDEKGTEKQVNTDILTPSNVFDSLVRDLVAVEDRVGLADLVITMTPTVQGLLQIAVKENISNATFSQGGIDLTVPAFNSVPIIRVASNRLVSDIDILSGSGNAGGFAKAEGAKDINWIISAKNVPVAVSKQDKMRIFDPNVFQGADAWSIDYRRYHELWIPDNKVAGVQISYAGVTGGVDGDGEGQTRSALNLDEIKANAEKQKLAENKVKYENMSVDEIKQELNLRGITYGTTDKKNQLIEQLLADDKEQLNK